MAKEHKFRWVVILWLFCVILLAYFDRVNLSMAAPIMMKEFGMGGGQMGMIMSGFFIGYMVLNFFAGSIISKFSSRKVLVFIIIAWSIMTALTGLANGFVMLFIIRFIFGLGEGTIIPCVNTVVNRYTLAKDKAFASALWLSAVPLGIVVGNMISGAIIQAFDWRSVFFIFGAAGIVMGWLSWKIVRDDPADHPSMSEEEVMRLKTSQVAPPSVGATGRTFVQVLANPWTWVLGLAFFSYSLTFYAQMSWLPTYFLKGRGTSYIFSGAMASVPWAFAIAGLFSISWLADHTFKQRGWWVAIGMFLCAPAMIFAVNTPDLTACVAFFAAAMFLNMGIQPCVMAISMTIIPAIDFPKTIGVGIACSSLAGILAPTIMGFILDITQSFNIAYYILSGVSLVGAVCGLVLAGKEKIVAKTASLAMGKKAA